jgi:hypothetical protein
MMTQFIDARMLAQMELEQYIEEQAHLIAPEYEIDSIHDIFGELYRVWLGTKLLGTFYLNVNGYWVSQPCDREERLLWLTSDGAFKAITNP